MSATEAQYTGCFLGLALGDAYGAPYESGPVERLLWRWLGKTREGFQRWTDDTQMALDLAESLLTQGRFSSDDIARRFGASYRWDRGYGPAAARLLKGLRRGGARDDRGGCLGPAPAGRPQRSRRGIPPGWRVGSFQRKPIHGFQGWRRTNPGWISNPDYTFLASICFRRQWI